MKTTEDAQAQISYALTLIRSMADVISAARYSSMPVLHAAASDLSVAARIICEAAGAIERLRDGDVLKLRTTAELAAAVRGGKHD